MSNTHQLAAVRHHGSNILQNLSVRESETGVAFIFTAIGFGNALEREESFDEARATLAAWAYLGSLSEADVTFWAQHRIAALFDVHAPVDLIEEGRAAFLAQGEEA